MAFFFEVKNLLTPIALSPKDLPFHIFLDRNDPLFANRAWVMKLEVFVYDDGGQCKENYEMKLECRFYKD